MALTFLQFLKQTAGPSRCDPWQKVGEDPTYHTAVYRPPTCTQRLEGALYVIEVEKIYHTVFTLTFFHH